MESKPLCLYQREPLTAIKIISCSFTFHNDGHFTKKSIGKVESQMEERLLFFITAAIFVSNIFNNHLYILYFCYNCMEN